MLQNIVAKVRALRGMAQQGQPAPQLLGPQGNPVRNAAEQLQQRPGRVARAIDEQTQ